MTFQIGQCGHNAEDAFTDDEVAVIWEQFFGKRWSLGHIATEHGAEKIKVVRAVEREAERRRKASLQGHRSLKLALQPLGIPASTKSREKAAS